MAMWSGTKMVEGMGLGSSDTGICTWPEGSPYDIKGGPAPDWATRELTRITTPATPYYESQEFLTI